MSTREPTPWRIQRTRDRDTTMLYDRATGAFVARLERDSGPSMTGGTTYYSWDAFDAENHRIDVGAYYRELCQRVWRRWRSRRTPGLDE